MRWQCTLSPNHRARGKDHSMTKKRLTLHMPFETHKKLKILSSKTNLSMTRIVVDFIDERYAEFERENQFLLSQKEFKFFRNRR